MANLTTNHVPVILTWSPTGAEDDDVVLYRYTCELCSHVISTEVLGEDAVCPTHGIRLSAATTVHVGDCGLIYDIPQVP